MKNNGDKKKKLVIIILIIFLFILLIATYFAYSYFEKKNSSDSIKNEFWSALRNNEISFFTDNKLYTNIIDKIDNNQFNSESEITLSSTMENNMFSELDLSKFHFNFNMKKDNKNNKTSSQLITKYAGNHFLTLDFITNSTQFALKSDELVNKYVGIDKENVQNIANEISDENIELANFKKLKNFALDREIINFENIVNSPNIESYAKILENNIANEDFSKKVNILVTLDSQQVTATEYTVSLNRNETTNFLNEISNSLDNSENLIKELIVSNVENFDEEKSGILEYTDNDSVLQIPAEENNFRTSMTIWNENTTTENSINENTISNQTDVINCTVQNTAIQNNTVVNQVNQTTTNEIQIENTIDSENVQPIPEQPENTIENTIEQSETEENLPVEETVLEQENTTNTPTIQEDENFRTQGFIEVNENGEPINDDEEFVIGANYQDTLKNISNLSSKIDWRTYLLTGAKANFSEEELIEKFQKILSDVIKSNSSLIIKVYVADNKPVKMNFEFPELEKSFDIEIVSKGDLEKYLNLKILNGTSNESNGYTVSFYKKQADADIKYKIAVNKINKNKITKKTNINLETKGTTSSKKYTTDADISYMDNSGELKMSISNILTFDDDVNVEDLTEENCLFMDKLSNEELKLTYQAIKEKTLDVLKKKNKALNIIEINNSNSVVEQNEVQNLNNQNAEEKANVKQALIQTISDKMRDYLNQGKKLTIQELDGLQIENYQTEISINSNLAIIVVNGYKFTLDSEFNLSDS